MSSRSTKQRKLSALLLDSSASVFPMAAVGMLVLVGLVGGSVDMAMAYRVHNRLQYACDAGALAGRRAVDSSGFDAAAQAKARSFFNGNFDQGLERTTQTTFTPTSDDNGNTIEAVARTVQPMILMRIFGYDEMPLTATCSASMSVGNSDVMMVLDNTGSMAGTRIAALRTAMKNFYSTVATATAGSNARIRYGFVPYSSTVNVGSLLSADSLKNSITVQSRSPVYETVQVQEFDHWGPPTNTTNSGYSSVSYDDWDKYSQSSYKKSNDCADDLPNNSNWSNNGGATSETDSRINSQGQKVDTTTTTQPQKAREFACIKSNSKYYIYSRYKYRDAYTYQTATRSPVYRTVSYTEFDHFDYKPVTYNVSNYKRGSAISSPIGDNGASVSSTWNGCIQERATVAQSSFSYSTLSGMDPSDAYDLDLDLPASTSDSKTQWAPLYPDAAYYRLQWVSQRNGGYWALSNTSSSLYGGKASSYCPRAARLLAPMSKSDFDNYADSLIAVGSTYHDIGMIWGGRLSSSDGMFATNVTASPSNGGAVARHIIFMTDGEMEPSNSILSGYGIEFHDRKITDDGSSYDAARHTARFRAVCDAVKAKGIRVWVIAFGTSMTSDLEYCASAQSAFTAADATQLNNSFQEIAKNVGELRIVQ